MELNTHLEVLYLVYLQQDKKVILINSKFKFLSI